MDKGMIEVEVLNAALHQENPIITSCVLKLHGKEIARTHPSLETVDPVWNEKFPKTLSELNAREKDYNRPFFFECIEIEIIDHAKSLGDKIVKLYEARVPLYDIGEFKSYRLLKTQHDHKGEVEVAQQGRIFVRLSIMDKEMFSKLKTCQLSQLCDVFPSHSAIYRHLFLDFSWSPTVCTFAGGMPGPNCGELVIDKHNFVEWRIASGINSFGDRLFTVCTGRLVVTDLRVIFVPYEVLCMPQMCGHISFKDKTVRSQWSKNDLLALHRYTYQLPLSAIQSCRQLASSDVTDTSCCSLILEGRDGSTAEFRIRMRPLQHMKHKSARTTAVDFAALPDAMLNKFVEKLANPIYRSGLDTNVLDPSLWCNRVIEYIQWQMKEDSVWLRWTKYIKLSCRRLAMSVNGKAWLKKARVAPDVEADFQRLRVQDHNWRLNDLNMSYTLCGSYPQYIVLPGTLEDEEVLAAASQRSSGRLPALSFIHPSTKAPLCRASQPKAGMVGGALEHDKKLLLAIKANSPSALPLRIADARPKLNANANAVQGKGFENVAFMGGPSNCSLVFLDIDNIHVMRHSLAKLRDGLHAIVSPSAAASAGQAGKESSALDDMNSLQASRWLNHVAGVLRGAAGVADSLCLGHAVLVHCSDGWDRTAQLTALAQILIDPYYRTVDGFYALINKEFCSFGHKFQHRLGDSGHKESSPVFLQFLDCVAQIHRQYPTHFEYSEYFLVFFAQCTYTGYFVTFRGNNERERYHTMRTVASFEDMFMDDFDFSTVSCYINLLLHRGGASSLLLNRLYVAPAFADRQGQYLRPRTGVSDMDLWRDGLSGLNPWLLSASSYGPPSSAHFEHTALLDNMMVRYKGYLDIHWQNLPPIVRQKLEILNAADGVGFSISGDQWGNISTTSSSASSSTGIGLKKRNTFCVAAAVKKSYMKPNSVDAFNVCDHATSTDPTLLLKLDGHTDAENESKRERAARTIQIWYISHLAAIIVVCRRIADLNSLSYGHNSPGISIVLGNEGSEDTQESSPVFDNLQRHSAEQRAVTTPARPPSGISSRGCSHESSTASLGPPPPCQLPAVAFARQVTKEAEEDESNHTSTVGPPLPPLDAYKMTRQITKEAVDDALGPVDVLGADKQNSKGVDGEYNDVKMLRQITKEASSNNPTSFGVAISRSSSSLVTAGADDGSLSPGPKFQYSSGVALSSPMSSRKALSLNDSAVADTNDRDLSFVPSLKPSKVRSLDFEFLRFFRQHFPDHLIHKSSAWRVLYLPCFVLVCGTMKSELHLRALLYQTRAQFIRHTVVDDAVEKALFICMRTEFAMNAMQGLRLSTNSLDGSSEGVHSGSDSLLMSPMVGGDEFGDFGDRNSGGGIATNNDASTPKKGGMSRFLGKKFSKMASFVKNSGSKHNSLDKSHSGRSASPVPQHHSSLGGGLSSGSSKSRMPVVPSTPPPASAAYGDEEDEEEDSDLLGSAAGLGTPLASPGSATDDKGLV